MKMIPVPEHGDAVSMALVKDAKIDCVDEKGERYDPIFCGFSDKVLPHENAMPTWQVQVLLPNGEKQDGIQLVYLFDGGWMEV